MTEVAQPMSAEQQALSALQDNIMRKGGNAYYHAHRPRNTGEAPAPPPVHVVLERCQNEVTETVETIFNYQFLDEGSSVKVYIPLEGVKEATNDDSVQCSFGSKSLEVNIRDYKPNKVLRLAVKELSGEIVPEECTYKRLTNKVTITLRKANTNSWSKLSSK